MPHPHHIYQAFYFKYEILKHFYAGNEFSRYRPDMSMEELIDLAYEIIAGDGVTPMLKDHIEGLIGKENCIYDFWEFGPDCFSLYWFIRKSVYQEKWLL